MSLENISDDDDNNTISLFITEQTTDISGNHNIPTVDIGSLKRPFSIGEAYPVNSSFVSKRYKTTKSKKVKKSKRSKKVKKPYKQKPIEKDPNQIINDLSALFEDVNPYYLYGKVRHIAHKKNTSVYSIINPEAKPAHIKIIYPLNKKTPNDIYAYYFLCYKTGTFFDWLVILGDYEVNGSLFDFSYIKNKFHMEIKNPITNQIIYRLMDEIFHDNQWVRWQFKRILNAWLTKKCKNRIIGADSDLVTGEPIPPSEQISILSIKNRTQYIFSGHVLLKTAKSCLEGQVGSIPSIKPPHNPYTNVPFNYGELTQMYIEIIRWCGQKCKVVPSIIALYREHKFKHQLLLRINHNYLQLKATESYMLNDDSRGEFFIENMESLLEDFALPLGINYDPFITTYQRFRLWNEIEPKNYLVLCWKKLASDYWYYKQTEHFPREYWLNETSIYLDIIVLLDASYDKLKNMMKMYNIHRRH